MFKGIDFYSDTVTRPTPAMRQAMLEAEVGDEQKGEDPTTLRLEEMAAEMLGHDSALFFPSATMANEIAIRLQCEPGDEMMADENAHVFFAEAGGPAVHAGVMVRPIRSVSGVFTGQDVRDHFRWSKGPHYPVSKLVVVENTTNMGGGIAWLSDELDSVLTAAKELGLKTHLDGSRLFNAAVKTRLSPRAIAGGFDTATICLSKGLGCPTGAVLVFEKSLFPRVRRLKQLMGGSMRQSGILAAAGIYALQYNVERLTEDHENAARLAAGLGDNIPYIQVENRPQSTNMVYFRWLSESVSSEQFVARCLEKGVRFSQVEKNRFRAVTHLDIQSEDVAQALTFIREVCSQF